MNTTLDTADTTAIEPLVVAGRTFRSRLILGTGKYPDFPTMAAALEASGTEVVTVALRRVNLDERGKGSLLDFVDPERYLRARAEEATPNATTTVIVVDGTAASVPLDDASVDAGVASLVLCSVADQSAALAELRRIIRPGGELRFYEHVIADNDRWARVQRRADPFWTRFAGGCHLARDTATAIRDAGFDIVDCERFLFQPCFLAKLAAPHILGRAIRA